ncbi:anti-sigma regulatory factor [Vibrio mangrovi]|uniref:Anti-sigma regulatory factor n=1 Tax=Vibrio mangrovi TaxID=474394 RepID=A0A1Y6IXY4_9VIBR|nr:anti-sigma regulatory factor [Vibrio mangrovi]MDW6001936.1 anti-sigma regulatory factor [Vibrio mangrovi]SMS02517.1 Serine/threonine-protein kinase RsbT [Vibrio mangrovi]
MDEQISVKPGSVYHIGCESDVMTAVMGTFAFARTLNFSSTTTSEIATVVSELATNIVKYAGEGRIELAEMIHGSACGIRVIASDRGPGIAQIEQALEEHFTTGGSLGMGLPGVKRMADEFQIESSVGRSSTEKSGTIVTVIKWGTSHAV